MFFDAITNVLIDSASCTIPNRRARYKQKPYWRELAPQCERKRALLWHSIWKDMGCPLVGDVADIRRKTRVTYHKGIRSITKCKQSLRYSLMAENIMSNKDHNMWKKVKQMKPSGRLRASMIDGVLNSTCIFGTFCYLQTFIAPREKGFKKIY